MPELNHQHAHWFPDMAEVVSREDAEKEITLLRAALKVACEEIRAHRSGCKRPLWAETLCAAYLATDAAIDLATGEPRT